MKPEEIEIILNTLIENTQKSNEHNKYLVNAIDSLSDKLSEISSSINESKTTKNIVMPEINTKGLELSINNKLSEFIGAMKNQTREYHYSKSYFLYPEGGGKKTFISMAIKSSAYVIGIIALALLTRFIVLKFEENSRNTKYRITLKYLYLQDNQTRDRIDNVLMELKNDSIHDEIIDKINAVDNGLK